MPLYQKTETDESTIGIWSIDEGLDFFETLFRGHPDIQNGSRRLQWFASRHLANIMLGSDDSITNDESGKPAFRTAPVNISISHTVNFAAVMLSKQWAVGIDVEKVTPKIERIAHKFLTADELSLIAQEEKIEKMILYWSAKEALFKLYGWGGLEFKTQLLIAPFKLENSGTLIADIDTPHLPLRNLAVHYRFFGDHVLTWVTGKEV